MPRTYTVQFNGVAVTAQQDLFELTAATNQVFELLQIVLSQSTEVGDAQEEGLSLLIKSGQTTSGSGGTAPTPVPVDFGDAAAGFAAEVNNTTKASAGTIVTLDATNWNVRVPHPLIWIPESRIFIRGARRMTVELATTPADSITMSGTMYVKEYG